VFTYLLGLMFVPLGTIVVLFEILQDPYAAVTYGLTAGYTVCGVLQIGSSVLSVRAGLRNVIVQAYAQPLTIAVTVWLGVACVIVVSGGSDNVVGRLCATAIALLLFFGGCYLFIATLAERQQVKRLIQIVV